MSKSALVTIDMHRGHLDPTVATLALPQERVTQLMTDVVPFVARMRTLGMPIIHVVTEYRDGVESLGNPFWRRHHDDPSSSRKQMTRHNIVGGPGTEIMAELYDAGDWVVRGKKRYDAFWQTDLDFLLSSHGIEQIYLIGVNTNSCILATAVAANVRDFDVTVVREGVSTMDDWGLHLASLSLVETAFGRVVGIDEISGH